MIMKRHEGEIEPIVENECTVEQALVDTPTAFTSTSVNQTRWSDRIELEYIKVEWHMVATAVWQLAYLWNCWRNLRKLMQWTEISLQTVCECVCCWSTRQTYKVSTLLYCLCWPCMFCHPFLMTKEIKRGDQNIWQVLHKSMIQQISAAREQDSREVFSNRSHIFKLPSLGYYSSLHTSPDLQIRRP